MYLCNYDKKRTKSACILIAMITLFGCDNRTTIETRHRKFLLTMANGVSAVIKYEEKYISLAYNPHVIEPSRQVLKEGEDYGPPRISGEILIDGMPPIAISGTSVPFILNSFENRIFLVRRADPYECYVLDKSAREFKPIDRSEFPRKIAVQNIIEFDYSLEPAPGESHRTKTSEVIKKMDENNRDFLKSAMANFWYRLEFGTPPEDYTVSKDFVVEFKRKYNPSAK